MSHVHVSCPWWCFVKCLQSYLCFSRFLLCVSRASCLSSPDCVHLCVVSLLCLTLISLQSVYSLSCRLCMFLVLLSCVLSLLGGAPLDLEIVFKDMFCICASCNYSTRKVGKWQARWSVSVIIDHTDVRLAIMMLLKQTVRLTIIKFQRNVYVSKERSVSSSKLYSWVYRVLVIHHLAGECGKQDATPRIQRLVLEEKMTESEKEKHWIKVTMIELSMRRKK